jgi:hypothetical protein
MDPRLEQRYRNRASLPPAERAAVEEAYAAALAEYETKYRTGSSPADLDPVEAADTPITPDPVAGPARSVNRAAGRTVAGQLYSPSEAVRGMQVGDMTREQAQRHRVRTVDPDLSVDNRVDENAIAIIAERHMASGVDRATAIAMARDHVLRAKQEVRNDMDSAPATDRSRAAEARQSRFEEDYGVATGAPSDSGLDGQDGSGRDWGNWKPGMPLPTVGGGGMRSGDDSQRGRGYQKVPGPRTPDGKPTAQGDTMWNPEAIEQYTTRQQDPETGMYSPSPKDSDMQKRGMVPVFNDDGSVGYSVAYGTGMQGGPGRAGPRKDLEKAGWVQETVEGPTGPQQVYRPGDKAKARYKEQDDDRARIRLAKRAGISGSEAMGMSVDDLRRSAKAAGIDNYNARNNAWKAQSMLAGGQPTGGLGGSKAITNALMMLPEDERNASLRYMLPGGQLAAGVDAQNMQNANDVIKRFMTSGAAAGMNNPLAQAQMEQMNRDKSIARADALIAKYPKGWDGMYSASDVAEVRNAVEKQHPGFGDAAVAHLRVRPEPPRPAPGGPPAPADDSAMPSYGI